MPVAPNQLPKLIVLLHVWNSVKDVPRYELQTFPGVAPIPVASLQDARDYSASHGYAGIKVVPT